MGKARAVMRIRRPTPRSVAGRVRSFVARETVLVVAAALALLSCAFVPPDERYAGYVDWHTLALLFCLMAVIAGLRSLGVLDAVGEWMVRRARTQRAVGAGLVAVVFLASMVVTNDVALITFVPLAIVVLRRAGMERHLCAVATLMTIGVNLGSMLTPIGNPQNLFLFTASGMGVGEFLLLTAPFVVASAVLLAGAVAVVFRGKRNAALPNGKVPPTRARACRVPPTRFALYAMLFAACVAAVVGLLDVRVLLALVLVTVVCTDATLLRRVDYGLLATFVALFVLVGNVGRLPVLHDALSAAVDVNALLAAVGASQLCGNVPAAVLLSGFTDQWPALIVGANLGGLGTLIASMASVITYKAVLVGRPRIRGRYLAVFTAWNAAFLAALLALAAVWGVG